MRHNILQPKRPAASLVGGSDAQGHIYYLFIGAASVAFVTIFIALVSCVLYYRRRWVDR